MITLNSKTMDSKNWIFILMSKFLVFIFYFLTVFSYAFASPNIQARTAILVDYHSDEILFELDPDSQIYPASMTKIMTSIIAFDLLKTGELSLNDKFLISENAWRMSRSGYSSMFIMLNDEVSVKLSREHSSYKWVDLNDAIHLVFSWTNKAALKAIPNFIY